MLLTLCFTRFLVISIVNNIINIGACDWRWPFRSAVINPMIMFIIRVGESVSVDLISVKIKVCSMVTVSVAVSFQVMCLVRRNRGDVVEMLK
jgi:hypothetical protein